MITVAVVGGDGSGKSTLIEALVERQPLPLRHIYMGANIESSNYALPWSRLALKVKLRRLAREAAAAGIDDPGYVSTHHMAHRQRRSSLVRTVARLSNRLTEAAYRHTVSFRLQRRGFHVLYDRHFAFDTFLRLDPPGKPTPVDRANLIYYRLLRRLFPEPDLILFLRADPAVMVARKPEATVDYLAARNEQNSRISFPSRRALWIRMASAPASA